MERSWKATRGIVGVAVMLAPAVACGAAGSDGGREGGGGQEETTDLLRDVAGFDVAAGEDTGWLLLNGEPSEIWEVGSDGVLTRRAELADGGDDLASFGDGLAVTRFVCTDATDDECGDPEAKLVLVDEHGSIDDELTLTRSDAGGLEGVGMTVVGASDDQLWVEVSAGGLELFAVSRSGDVETIPFERRQFAHDQLCAIDGELMMLRVHTDLYDPEQGPPDTGVLVSAETPIRTTVSLDAWAEREWRPVPGSERSFELRGDEARAVCRQSYIGVEGSGAQDDKRLARWTRDGGWVEAPADPVPAAPPGHIGVDGCADCVWAPDGRILRRGGDGTFQATGLEVRDPDGADDAPAFSEVDIGLDGTMVVCAVFPQGRPVVCDRTRA